jgi:CysZ protein
MFKELIISIQSFFEAHRFIGKNKLWRWILIPGLFYALLFMAGLYFFGTTSNSATIFLLQKTGLKSWLDSMQQSWLSWLFIVAQIFIMIVLFFFYFSLFKYIFLIVASPVFAYLSEKTESILLGKDFPFSTTQLLSDIVRGVRIALRNMLWQTVYLIAIIIFSFIPVVGWVGPIIAFFIECYYFGFSMLDYSSERNKLNTAQSISFIGNHKGLAIGNGIGFYFMHLIPFLGWLLAPSYAVVAATLSLHKAKNDGVTI